MSTPHSSHRHGNYAIVYISTGIVVNKHNSLEQRLDAAATAMTELERQVNGAQAVLMGVDGMDDQLESSYESIPNRL